MFKIPIFTIGLILLIAKNMHCSDRFHGRRQCYQCFGAKAECDDPEEWIRVECDANEKWCFNYEYELDSKCWKTFKKMNYFQNFLSVSKAHILYVAMGCTRFKNECKLRVETGKCRKCSKNWCNYYYVRGKKVKSDFRFFWW